MKSWIFAGAACAALVGAAQPALAATPLLPNGAIAAPGAHQAVGVFYASRSGAPLWLKSPSTVMQRPVTGLPEQVERAPSGQLGDRSLCWVPGR